MHKGVWAQVHRRSPHVSGYLLDSNQIPDLSIIQPYVLYLTVIHILPSFPLPPSLLQISCIDLCF